MATTNMGLNQPVPGTQGPDWANQINDNSSIIDSHDHSSGKGVLVTPAGLNINTDLPVNENKITDLKSVQFISQTSSLTGSSAKDLYIKNGDLFYANGLTDVQITNGGSVAGASGNIAGLASPASATFAGQQFSFFYDAGTYADLRCRDLVLSNNPGNTVKLTHTASTSYTLSLPPAPPSTSTQMLTMSTGGAVTANTSPTLGNTTSVFTWQGTTNSTAVGNGAVVVAGGVSVGQTLRVGNGCRIDNGLSITNFGLGIDSGGATIVGSVGITGNTTVTGTFGVTGNTTLTGTLTTTGVISSPTGIATGNVTLRQKYVSGGVNGSGVFSALHGVTGGIYDVAVWVQDAGTQWTSGDRVFQGIYFTTGVGGVVAGTVSNVSYAFKAVSILITY